MEVAFSLIFFEHFVDFFVVNSFLVCSFVGILTVEYIRGCGAREVITMEFARVRVGTRIKNPSLQWFANQGGKFARVNGRLYAAAGDEHLLEEFIDNPTFEDVSNLVDFEGGPQLDQIELNEIYTNDAYGWEAAADVGEAAPTVETAFAGAATEATPLIGGGAGAVGGILGTSGATAGSGFGAVVTGGIISAGAVIIGTTAGLLTGTASDDTTDDLFMTDDDHQDPVVSLPDHRYIGPGNTVDEAPPVDTDDTIAREHDVRYEEAKTQEDIQKADEIGINEFVDDAIEGNVHSAVGAIGLGIKKKIEQYTGVIYPPNLPSGE
nr:VP2 [Mute swan feces associated ambidensovirus 3]